MKKNINEIKEHINNIKQSVDAMKNELQEAVRVAKETAQETKNTKEQAKETVQELKSSAGIAQENLQGTGKTIQSLWQREIDGAKETFELEKQGNGFVISGVDGRVGEITYTPADESTWVLDHTYVTPKYRGRDIAQHLLLQVAAQARMEGKKIIPSCSYAAAQFRRNPIYADVWKR